MAKLKTTVTDADVTAYIEQVDNAQKRSDSYRLVELFSKLTGHPPKMWGPSIIGFDKYHYKSERSSQEGDWPIIGFSPRKAAISLYIYTESAGSKALLEKLGKYTMGKACIYVKKLSDIDESLLTKIASNTVEYMRKKFPA